MEINKFDNINVEVYSEKLSNGLSVYIVPLKNRNNVYVTFSTKFGSRINEFVPIDENKMVKVPYGVAHFLEHKMFEQEDGIDPFTFYSERGASANANTTYDKTTYLFSGKSFLEDNINYLLDYVQKPYFTDENVEKEKGIIVSECEMYRDKSYTRCYEKILENSFIEDPINVPIIGTIESINSITKEDLYKCYNTFYHPANMFMVITGNVEPEKMVRIIKDNQDKKNFNEFKRIKVKTYNEPSKIKKKYDEIKMDITIPKVMIAYKIDLTKFSNMEIRKIKDYISIIFDIKFGDTSIVNERFVEEQIVNGGIGIELLNVGDYLLVILSGESDNADKFINEIDKEIKKINILEEELERKKKVYIGNIVALSNNIYSLNNKIMSNIIKYDKIIYDDYTYINSLNINELELVKTCLDLSNKTVCKVKPN